MRVTTADIQKLKTALREDTMPLLTEEEIFTLIESADSIDEAIYNGAIMKSENTALQVSGMSTADTSSYFLRIARMHRPNHSGTLRG